MKTWRVYTFLTTFGVCTKICWHTAFGGIAPFNKITYFSYPGSTSKPKCLARFQFWLTAYKKMCYWLINCVFAGLLLPFTVRLLLILFTPRAKHLHWKMRKSHRWKDRCFGRLWLSCNWTNSFNTCRESLWKLAEMSTKRTFSFIEDCLTENPNTKAMLTCLASRCHSHLPACENCIALLLM